MILCAWLRITYEEMELQFFNYKDHPFKYSPLPFLFIHPFFQFFPTFKKRKLLRFDLDLFTGFWIPAGV